MKVMLLAHTQLSDEFLASILGTHVFDGILEVSDGKMVALTAIRTCYSHNRPSVIIPLEGERYFGQAATDGQSGTEADRLIRHIVSSKHLSTLEHISFTFAIEGVSRALLAQLTRHRVGFSYSVQSQRYVRFGSSDKSGGFDYVTPQMNEEVERMYRGIMSTLQIAYDELRSLGVSAEDARMLLPNAASTNLVMTANLRALLDFYSKRRKGRGAQAEIAELAERLREEVVAVEPWTDAFFEQA